MLSVASVLLQSVKYYFFICYISQHDQLKCYCFFSVSKVCLSITEQKLALVLYHLSDKNLLFSHTGEK